MRSRLACPFIRLVGVKRRLHTRRRYHPWAVSTMRTTAFPLSRRRANQKHRPYRPRTRFTWPSRPGKLTGQRRCLLIWLLRPRQRLQCFQTFANRLVLRLLLHQCRSQCHFPHHSQRLTCRVRRSSCRPSTRSSLHPHRLSRQAQCGKVGAFSGTQAS